MQDEYIYGMNTPVYQYNASAVEQRLVKTLKKRRREATVADLVAETGLPSFQVEEQLKRIVNDYQGHLKVTESGEILYHFPDGMRNQVRGAIPKARRVLRKVASVAGRILKTAFKVWTMVMLVGYFVVFVLLIVLAVVASMAAQAKGGGNGGGGRGRMGGFGSFYLTTRLMQMSMYLWLYSGGRPDRRGNKPKERPLHQSVFAFIFGDGDPAGEWDERERRAFIAYLRASKGVSTVEDLMQLTGRSYNDSQRLLNRLSLEFDGEPDVTDEGTLMYRFDQVLRSSDRVDQPPSRGTEFHRELKPLIPFNTNKPGLNRWIGFFNGFNLLFGTYFTAFALAFPAISEEGIGAFFILVASLFAQITTNPVGVVFWVMGVIPLVFSGFFFLIPAVRRARERRANRERARENVRKRVINAVLAHPGEVDPEMIQVSGTPGVSDEEARSLLHEIVREYAAERGADVEEKRPASGTNPAAYVYRFGDVEREQQDISAVRARRNVADHDIGDVVFDSGSD